jgi:hypothetical protein
MASHYRRKTAPEPQYSHADLTQRLSFGKKHGQFYRQIFFAAADMSFLPSFIECGERLAIFQALVSC